MLRKLLVLALLLAGGLAQVAQAQGTAQKSDNVYAIKEYWCQSYFFSQKVRPPFLAPDRSCNGVAFTYDTSQRMTVGIRLRPEDVGLPGTFFVAITQDRYPIGIFTTLPQPQRQGARFGEDDNPVSVGGDGVWLPWKGGLLESAADFDVMPPETRYVVMDHVYICDGRPDGTYTLYAGYGVLDGTGQMMVNQAIQFANPNLSPDHIRKSYIQRSVNDGNRYWPILTITCPSLDDLPLPKNDAGS